MKSWWIGRYAQRSSAILGAWVFRGTRVPVSALFENLEDEVQIAQFVEWFPGVDIEQERGALDHAAKSLAVSQAV